MTLSRDLARLSAVAGLLKDAELARLSAAVASRARTEALLAGLVPGPPAPELDPALARRNADLYAAWVDQRRNALAAQLAEEEATVAALKGRAARAFGRSRVIDRMLAALPPLRGPRVP